MGFDVEPLSFTSYLCHYKWYYSSFVDAAVISIKKGSENSRNL
jgi:hypothetical protein